MKKRQRRLGLIITEDYAINEHAKGYRCIGGLYKDEKIPSHKKLTDTIHKYDSKIFCQIYHAGRQSTHFVNGGVQPIAPSAIPCPMCREKGAIKVNHELIRRILPKGSFFDAFDIIC